MKYAGETPSCKSGIMNNRSKPRYCLYFLNKSDPVTSEFKRVNTSDIIINNISEDYLYSMLYALDNRQISLIFHTLRLALLLL